MVHEYTQAPSILSVSCTWTSGCLPPITRLKARSTSVCMSSFIFVPFVSFKDFAVHCLWLANVRSSPITIPLFFILRRLAKIWSRSFLSKNLTRTGLDLVPVGVPVLWATSVSVTAVLTLTFWSKMSQHFFLQSSAVSPSPSGTLNTRRFQRLEYCCCSYYSFCIFLTCCSCALSIFLSESFFFFFLFFFNLSTFCPPLRFFVSVSNTLPSSFSICECLCEQLQFTLHFTDIIAQTCLILCDHCQHLFLLQMCQ